jgi:hypothetical protein
VSVSFLELREGYGKGGRKGDIQYEDVGEQEIFTRGGVELLA